MSEGAVMKHEVLEAHAGAVLNPGTPSTAEDPGSIGFDTAHTVSNNIYPGGNFDAKAKENSVRIGRSTSNIRHVGGGTVMYDLHVRLTKPGKSVPLFTEQRRIKKE